MSATLDGARVARLLGGAPVVRSRSRAFPVETVYAPPMPDARAFADAIARLTRRALGETDGGVLVFCPGEARSAPSSGGWSKAASPRTST